MNRVILITGSSRGLGASLVSHYLGCGDWIAGCARGAAPVEHDRYVHYAADVTDEVSMREVFADVRRRWGRLDVLINNAGIASMNPVALLRNCTRLRTVSRMSSRDHIAWAADTQEHHPRQARPCRGRYRLWIERLRRTLL
jgi:NAD(P)-dependent dehydrogenase (short-subunit alcohol dehydrogenase family)